MPSYVIGRGLGQGLATASAAAFAMPSLGMPSFASDISAPRHPASSYSLVAGSPPPSARLARYIAYGTDGPLLAIAWGSTETWVCACGQSTVPPTVWARLWC